MADITYECDEDGIIHGKVSDGVHAVEFTLATDTIMHGKDQGLHLLDEMIAAALKDLADQSSSSAAITQVEPMMPLEPTLMT